MKIHDEFIAKYKELERSLDVPVAEYEKTLEDTERQKMTLCRMTRNYIQHVDDYNYFIGIGEGMYKFLCNQVYAVQSKNGILKDHMQTIRKYGSVAVTDTVFDAAAIMKSKGTASVVVLDKENHFAGFITKDFVSDLFGIGAITKVTPIKNLKEKMPYIKAEFINKEALMKDVLQKVKSSGAKYVIALNANNTVCGVLPCDNLTENN